MSPQEIAAVPIEGLWLALRLVLPLVVVGALAAMVAGALTSLLGIVDGMAARASKTLAVVAALTAMGGWMTSSARDYAQQSWSAMADVDGASGQAP